MCGFGLAVGHVDRDCRHDQHHIKSSSMAVSSHNFLVVHSNSSRNMERCLPLRCRFLLFLLCCAAIPLSDTTAAPPLALFILGDSTVNCGDNTVFYPFLPKNGSTSAVCRTSPRPLLPDIIAEKMGLGRVPSFYASDGSPGELLHGVNFGSTPATIISSVATTATTNGESSVVETMFMFQTLSQQVRQTYETLQLLRLELGPTAASEHLDKSIFLLSFGKDDLVAVIEWGFAGASALAPKYSRRGIARFLANQMILAVKELYNAEVRRMAVVGVGPLGCAPRVMWLGGGGEGADECINEANKVVEHYNILLAHGLRRASTEMPGAQIVFCDVYKGVMEIISRSHLYGFDNANEACCGSGRLGGMIGCLSSQLACSDPSTHVWWDLYSTTTATTELLVDWMWSPDAALQLCQPLALQHLSQVPI